MSEENLEVIRAAHAAVNRRDLDALLALAHPEVEFRSLIAEAEGRDYRGHAGVREWWESVIQSLGGMHSVIEHTEAFEDGAISRVRLSGEVEGVGLSQTVWEAFRIRDGVLVWWCFYRTEAEALEAVGLREEAMSQENVEARNEVVRRFVAAFESDTAAFRDTLHPEIEWYPIEENRTPTKGIEAAMWNRNAWLNTWDEHSLDLEEVIEDGDDVVAGVHITARGAASGVEVDVRFYAQIKVRDGKIVYIYDHEDRDEALEAAGLRE